MTVKDACIRKLRETRGQNEEEKWTLAEHPGHRKRAKIIVDIQNYNNLKKKLVDHRKMSHFSRQFRNIEKAQLELFKKKPPASFTNSEC